MHEDKILIGANHKGEQIFLDLKMANRHGLISGATGTGKTVTLQILSEGFSKAGVPVFTADVKGDLAGLCCPGEMNPKIEERLRLIGNSEYQAKAFPTVFWDVFGEKGHPVRATVSEMGPLLLSRLLQLSDTEDAILHMVFKIADDQGLLLLDLKDLSSLLRWIGNNEKEYRTSYGNVPVASVAAIQRQILVLGEAGGEQFFGEPALQFNNLIKTDFSGNGVINILDARKLMVDPRIYSVFLLWLLSEIFENMEEIGDSEKPRLVFFFDEAHLLFTDAPKTLISKIEQVVRLIRSKGVGIYFVTQNPLDIPETIRGQLGNRIQHALRSYTPKDHQAIETAAKTFVTNPAFDMAEKITSLAVGEGLVSVLDHKGRPSMTEDTIVCPPESRMGPITDAERSEKIKTSPLFGIYETPVDRESAYEILAKRTEQQTKESTSAISEITAKSKGSGILDLFGTGKRQSYAETFAKQMVRSVGSRLATQLTRSLLGSLKK